MTKKEKFCVDLLKKINKFEKDFVLDVSDKYIMGFARGIVFETYVKESNEEVDDGKETK